MMSAPASSQRRIYEQLLETVSFFKLVTEDKVMTKAERKDVQNSYKSKVIQLVHKNGHKNNLPANQSVASNGPLIDLNPLSFDEEFEKF
jgi:hypothetical protein